MKKEIKRFIRMYLITPSVAYFHALLPWSTLPEKKFILFFRPRSGSNLLRDILNSHPDIFCDEEIFRYGLVGKVSFPSLYIKGRCTQYKKNVCGFKVNIHQLTVLQQQDPQSFLTSLTQQGWKIVYIERRNLLTQAISFFVAQKREIWLDKAENALKDFRMSIDCDELVQKMERMEKAVAYEKELLAPFPYQSVVYEDNLLNSEHRQEALDKVFAYLGVESVPVKTSLVKTTTRKYSDFIDNYAEMVEVVKQTKYAKWLAEIDS